MKTFEVSATFKVFGTIVVDAKDKDSANAIARNEPLRIHDIQFESFAAELDTAEPIEIKEQA